MNKDQARLLKSIMNIKKDANNSTGIYLLRNWGRMLNAESVGPDGYASTAAGFSEYEKDYPDDPSDATEFNFDDAMFANDFLTRDAQETDRLIAHLYYAENETAGNSKLTLEKLNNYMRKESMKPFHLNGFKLRLYSIEAIIGQLYILTEDKKIIWQPT